MLLKVKERSSNTQTLFFNHVHVFLALLKLPIIPCIIPLIVLFSLKRLVELPQNLISDCVLDLQKHQSQSSTLDKLA